MKFLNQLFRVWDKKTDKIEKESLPFVKKYFPIFSSVFLGLLFVGLIFKIYKSKPVFEVSVISRDLKIIVESLNEIDKACSILSFKHDRNYVDFLNVEKFVSSEVGCLNLVKPKNWQGPYVQDNPTMQGKLYEILKAKDGFFVVPGTGVKFSNDFIMGKDIQITVETIVADLLKEGGALNYEGQPLALRLDFTIGDWGKEELIETEEAPWIESVARDMAEFNSAMPFTNNESVEVTC